MTAGPYTPQLVVQFAFGVGPLADPSAAWVTPSNAKVTVEGVQIERGRTSEFDDFPPSTCTIQIKDGNRIFDPSNAAGPYYGQLKPRVWVRVRGYISPTYYDRFTGYVDGWPLQNGRGLATVTLTATDAQKILASTRLPQSVYETVVLADTPVGYWKLGDLTGERTTDSSGNRYDGTYTGVVQRGQQAVVPYSTDASIGLGGNDSDGVVLPDAARLDSFPVSVEAWVRCTTQPTDTNQRGIYGQPAFDTISHEGWLLAIGADSPTDHFVIVYYVGATYTPGAVRSWTVDLYDGRPHHLVLTLDTSSPYLGLYLDGAVAPPRAFALGGVTATAAFTPFIGSYAALPTYQGNIDDVAIYDQLLSAADVLAHYTAGAAPWYGDTTGARINRVLDLIGWPAGNRAIDTGEMLCGSASLEGMDALTYLKNIAKSEQGRLFIDASGNVTFHDRGRFLRSATETTSQFTFSDDGLGDSIYDGLNFTLDETKIVNSATATRVGGSPQTAIDSASQTSYGSVAKTLDGLVLTEDSQARSLAEYMVYRYGTPQVRAEGWSLQPELDASSWPKVFGLEIGQRVTLECKPVNVGSQIVVDQHLERIHEDITPSAWTIQFNGSPIDPNAASYLIFDGVGATQGFDVGKFR